MSLLPIDGGMRGERLAQGRSRSRARQWMLRIFAALVICATLGAIVDWLYWPSPRKLNHSQHWYSPSLPLPALPQPQPRPSPATATDDRFENSLLLTFKTGSRVIYQRAPLPVQHLAASRHQPSVAEKEQWHEYIPNQLFYSDAEEWIGDTHFVDALANVSKTVQSFDGFEEHGKIQRLLGNGQDPSHPSPSGTPSPGWKLDKFKFLPMHADAARRFPDVKYTISIEDDTFLFWNQIVKWLKLKERQGKGPEEVKLWGSPTVLLNGSLPFTHGGSGYIMSRGLVQQTFGRSPWTYEHNETFAHYMRYSCCGDAELSRSFQLTLPGFEPTFSESDKLFTGEPPSRFAFVPSEWCEPILTLHRVTGFEYVRMLEFKRRVEPLIRDDDWLRRIDIWDGMMPAFLRGKVSTASAASVTSAGTTGPLVAHGLVAEGWQAIPEGSGNHKAGATTKDVCQRLCEDDSSCLTWTFLTTSNHCLHSSTLYIGVASSTAVTGYQAHRINELRARQSCAGRLGDLGAVMAAARKS